MKTSFTSVALNTNETANIIGGVNNVAATVNAINAEYTSKIKATSNLMTKRALMTEWIVKRREAVKSIRMADLQTIIASYLDK